MALPLCEICQSKYASVWICLQFQGETEQHQICMDCVGQIANGELTQIASASNLDIPKLKNVLEQLQTGWKEAEEEDATFQKLQAMMGDDAPWDVVADEVKSPNAFESGDNDATLRCSHCQTSWKDVHEGGLMGCPHCYMIFADEINKVMEELHHSVVHVGKVPRFRQKQERQAEVRQKRQLHRQEMLQKRLDAALQAERYEEAAQIRDKIAQVIKSAV